jgi:hypothetical protein
MKRCWSTGAWSGRSTETTWRAQRTRNRELAQQRLRAEEREALAIDAVRKFGDAVQANPELKNRRELDSLRKTLLKEPL